MWELIIAVIGGLFLGYKYFSDKASKKAFDDRMQIYKSQFEEYSKRYEVTAEERRRFIDFVMSGEHYDELCAMFESYFIEVLGDDWKNKLHLPNPNMSAEDRKYWLKHKDNPRANWHSDWVYNLLLAHHKRLTSVYSVATITGDDKWRPFQIKTLKTVEDEFHKQGETNINFAVLYETDHRTSENPAGGTVIILGLNSQPAFRLWPFAKTAYNKTKIKFE